MLVISQFIPLSSVCITAPRRKRLGGDSGPCTKQTYKKVHAKKSPSVVPGVEEVVAIVGESSSVLAPNIFADETSSIIADVASSVPADVDVVFLMEDIICDDIAGSSNSVVDEVAKKQLLHQK